MPTFIIIGFLYTGAVGTRAASSKSYRITSANIETKLLQDGSMQVKESRQYNFNGSYTFAYQYINKRGGKGIENGRSDDYILTDFSLCQATNCYKRLNENQIQAADSSRPAGTFYVREEADRY